MQKNAAACSENIANRLYRNAAGSGGSRADSPRKSLLAMHQMSTCCCCEKTLQHIPFQLCLRFGTVAISLFIAVELYIWLAAAWLLATSNLCGF
eukprot:5623222-Pyramimonas_sp.AAC.1